MSRREARTRALQILFQVDLGKITLGQALEYTLKIFPVPKKTDCFVRSLANGTFSNLQQIDLLLHRFSIDWQIKRMANVDRNILRIALYEMLYLDEIPPQVTINEAVELGKQFGGENSGRFINGILGKVIEHLPDLKKEEGV